MVGDLEFGATPEGQSGGDLEYDLAHEAIADTPSPAGTASDPHVHVVIDTDYDGDYSYDLAHDIRKR